MQERFSRCQHFNVFWTHKFWIFDPILIKSAIHSGYPYLKGSRFSVTNSSLKIAFYWSPSTSISRAEPKIERFVVQWKKQHGNISYSEAITNMRWILWFRELQKKIIFFQCVEVDILLISSDIMLAIMMGGSQVSNSKLFLYEHFISTIGAWANNSSSN